MRLIDRAGLVAEIRARAAGRARFLVALTGPPGAGKSTLAATLASDLGGQAAVLPMDGFHLDNDRLRQLGRLARKGAPDTFDVAALAATLDRVRAGGPVACPGFDRAADRTLPGALRIRADTRIVLVEGNYLTLTTAPWSGLARFFDLTVALDLDRAALAARLIRRWRDHGLTEAAARARVAGNDLPNADTVARRARAPDFLLRGDAPRAKGPDRHR